MPRPRKDGRLRMDTDLRIPLTSKQKSLIVAATQGLPDGMAAWARVVLLQAARRIVTPATGLPGEVRYDGGDAPAG